MRMDQYSPYLTRALLVANRKGGVLKSSIVRSVSDWAVRSGYRVAVIDGDPQGNLSKIDFGLDMVEVGGWETDRGRSLAMALQYGTDLTVMQAHGVDVVCGGPELLQALAAANGTDVDLAGNLRASLARLCSQNKYDLVLFDSGPGDTKLLDAYMLACKWLVVPVVDDDPAAFDGLDKLGARTVELIRTHDADIEVLGAVLTLVDPTATVRNKEVLGELAEMLGDAAEPFTSTIRDSKPGRGDTRRYGLSAQQVAEKSKDVRKSRFDALRARAAEIAPQVKEYYAELVEEFKTTEGRKPDTEERKMLRKQASATVRAEQDARKPGRHKQTAEDKLANPDERWNTRDGDGLASDYDGLGNEIVTRIVAKLEARVA